MSGAGSQWSGESGDPDEIPCPCGCGAYARRPVLGEGDEVMLAALYRGRLGRAPSPEHDVSGQGDLTLGDVAAIRARVADRANSAGRRPGPFPTSGPWQDERLDRWREEDGLGRAE